VLEIIYKVNKVIVNPLIVMLIAVAVVIFFWGVFEFVAGAGNEEKRDKGKRNMIWGLIGLFVMVGVFGIIQIILGTFDIPPPQGNIFP
jgi:uncharacterized membrane protein